MSDDIVDRLQADLAASRDAVLTRGTIIDRLQAEADDAADEIDRLRAYHDAVMHLLETAEFCLHAERALADELGAAGDELYDQLMAEYPPDELRVRAWETASDKLREARK